MATPVVSVLVIVLFLWNEPSFLSLVQDQLIDNKTGPPFGKQQFGRQVRQWNS